MFKNLLYDATLNAVQILKLITNANVHITGLENIQTNTTNIFIANHFSRIETLLIANLIYKKSGIQVRALADHSIFLDKTKQYLKNIGLVNVADKNRDMIILNDLIQGANNWLIFPEGKMVKNKKHIYLHTGASVLALEAYLLQEEYKLINHDSRKIAQFKEDNNLYKDSIFSNQEINICPISINYFDLRDGKNYISNSFKTNSQRLNEEIIIESNMLLHGDIIVNVLEPVPIKEYVKKYNLDDITKNRKFIFDKIRIDLTKETMKTVYQNISISIEHIVALLLWFYPHSQISLNNFNNMVFCIVSLIRNKNYNLHTSIENELLELAIGEKYAPLGKVIKLAKKQKIIKVHRHHMEILKNNYEENYNFHSIRIKNTLKVILNEALSVNGLSTLTKKVISLSEKDVKKEIAKNLIKYDKLLYNEECKNADDIKIKKTNAQAKLLKGKLNIGIILSHGFSSSPNEVARLARKLNHIGYYVYITRAKGHSIDAQFLSTTSYKDWLHSYNIGYGILKQVCDKVIFAGFSMGGLLALLSASNKHNSDILGIVAISPALKIKDFRVNQLMLGTTVLFNDLLSKENSLGIDYVDNNPEYPEFNYNKHYIKSIKELNVLMNTCEKNLDKIKHPMLIINNKIDPIIDSKSAITINNTISSKIKMTYSLSSKQHVIVNNNKLDEVFTAVCNFIGSLKV